MFNAREGTLIRRVSTKFNLKRTKGVILCLIFTHMSMVVFLSLLLLSNFFLTFFSERFSVALQRKFIYSSSLYTFPFRPSLSLRVLSLDLFPHWSRKADIRSPSESTYRKGTAKNNGKDRCSVNVKTSKISFSFSFY